MADFKKEPSESGSSNEGTLASKNSEQRQHASLQFDLGNEMIRFRSRWWQIWIPRDPPLPPPEYLSDALVTPLVNASLFSQLTYAWITPMMTLGYQRTLQATDLWKMDETREAGRLSLILDQAWDRRKREAITWNLRLLSGEIKPGIIKRFRWTLQALLGGRNYSKRLASHEARWREIDGQKTPSLAWALNDTFGYFFWSAGAFKVFGDTAQLMGPLVVKSIINFAKARSTARANGTEIPNIGRGVAMCIGLFLLVVTASITQHQFFWRAMTTGVLARAALINSIYKRGVKLTGRARTTLPNASLINHISTDVSRIDACAQWFHAGWTAPIQVTVCLIILLVQLGPSALAGFALFLCIAPIQERFMAYQLRIRRESMRFSDNRAKTLLEVLSAMRVVKYFCYEEPFLKRDTISWTSATKINEHILEVLTDIAFTIDHDQEFALEATNVTFEWESFPSQSAQAEEKSTPSDPITHAPFKIRDLSMMVPRGSLVAIVGRVGSGKSSLLQGLIGEMRLTGGRFAFGGRVAYCPQSAWIQNATLRDNVLFGQPFEEDRYWRVIEDSCLLPDLQVLSDGDMTEIGEKGINLSGGQKQRVNIARALYYNADIVLLDDPLSAVDAHVGKALFHDAIIGSLRDRGKSVILVTHALHFLSQCDYIYTLRDGVIAEHGTYNQLISNNGEFARLDKEFGGNESHQVADKTAQSAAANTIDEVKLESNEASGQLSAVNKLNGKLIVKERRSTGSVSWKVYWTYLAAGRGYITGPFLLLAIILMQGSQIINSYTLVWWQADAFRRPFSFYQGLYAGLGLSQAFFTFVLGIAIDTISWFVSQNLHHDSVRNIFYARMSFFDTTPLGRILGVFGKDIDNIDNQLPVSMRLLLLTLSNVLGAVIIISVIVPYFLIAALLISLAYQYYAAFYRASAREVKRLDSMLRSVLYAHFSESLTGLPTIRSYGEVSRFIKENTFHIDLENRALFLTVTNQRWLAIRLDFCGAGLVFVVGLLAVIGVSGISPAQVGLVLTYTTTLTQLCGMLTRQTAEVENYMNSVERVVHYSRTDFIEQEAPHEIAENQPPPHWPQYGSIEFKRVSMNYRPGLPKVLRDLSLKINGGEKIGVVGRTGAGKSSLALCLLRIVEYDGSIVVDDIDIGTIGLKDLRSKISIIPQDPTLFSGTVRSALDPFSIYDDTTLWDALRRSFLVESRPLSPSSTTKEATVVSPTPPDRISLDMVIEPEGSNFSIGERSLLSLARALVKETRVVILDEATASVDLETDKKIQNTIKTQFKDRTLICIAHRLRTIIHYDRILVLDGGCIAEFDTPWNLFMREGGFFRGLCDKSNITLRDIESTPDVE
ncbi:Multidrug resistance-associated protein 1 [Hypsizygus marmoreus]|uniref:Multidrug resistance-associated protein 1 n=1 Tax=Hypsizygus marmoreus TaxID=39966 RepID=A0A369JYA6_HYPMA|nr:Multidrug resistance-associated protein 1 [Hypsizygus marmoreus]